MRTNYDDMMMKGSEFETEKVPLQVDQLTAESKQFYRDLIAWRPDWTEFCKMERGHSNGAFDLYLELPSPTGNDQQNVVVWVSDGDLSLGFGPWHTHGNVILEKGDGYYEELDLIDAVKLIVGGNLVCFYESADGQEQGGILDLRNPDAVLDEITDKYSSGKIQIRSWDGAADRVVDIASAKDT